MAPMDKYTRSVGGEGMACPVFIVTTRDYVLFLTLHQSWEQMKGIGMTYLPDVVISSECVELAAGHVSLFGVVTFKE